MYYLLAMGVTHERDPIRMRWIMPKEQLALHAATQTGRCSVVLELLLSSVDVNCRNGQNLTALEIAQHLERTGRNVFMFKFLLIFWRRREQKYGLEDILACVTK
jgi:hypothetical protein